MKMRISDTENSPIHIPKNSADRLAILVIFRGIKIYFFLLHSFSVFIYIEYSLKNDVQSPTLETYLK